MALYREAADAEGKPYWLRELNGGSVLLTVRETRQGDPQGGHTWCVNVFDGGGWRLQASGQTHFLQAAFACADAAADQPRLL